MPAPSASARANETRGQIPIQERLQDRLPRWLRMGIPILLVLAITVVVAGTLIRYPEVVSVPVLLHPGQKYTEVRTSNPGNIGRLAAPDGSRVDSGQVLATLGQGIRESDLIDLTSQVKALSTASHHMAPPAYSLLRSSASWPSDIALSLSELQHRLDGWSRTWEEKETARRVKVLEQELVDQKRRATSLSRQLNTLRQEVDIAEKRMRNSETLFQQGAISELEVDANRMAVLQYRRELEALRNKLIDNDMRRSDIRDQIETERNNRSRILEGHRLETVRQARALLTRLRLWKESHQFRAPTDGRLDWSASLQEGQYVQAGDLIFRVFPEDTSKATAEGFVAAEELRKLNTGMEARIRLEAWPHRRYGQLTGTLQHISPSISAHPSGSGAAYRLEILLTSGLTTHYGYTPDFSGPMPGEARLIGKKKSFLGRILGHLWE